MDDDKRYNQNQDTYDMLHRSFSMNDTANSTYDENTPYNRNGEVYFSSKNDGNRQSQSDTKLYDSNAIHREMSSQRRGASSSASRSAYSGSYGSRASSSQSYSSGRTASDAYGYRGTSGRSSTSSQPRSTAALRSRSTATSSSSGNTAASQARSRYNGGRSSSASQQGTRSSGARSAATSTSSASQKSRTSSTTGRTSAARSYDRPSQHSSTRNASTLRSSTAGASSRSAKAKESEAYKETTGRNTRKKRTDTKKRGSGFTLAAIVVIFVVVFSFLLRIPIMGCINDIVAINRDATEIRVTVGQNMNTNDVIDLLKENDLIFSAEFCKFIYSLMGHDETEIYPAGTYEVSADMGLEGMMREIITAGATDSTVSITFPEGFTLDQIIEKLASNGVCSSSALYAVVDDPVFLNEFDFLADIDNREQRYHYLEGYLYPDTYEFYIGENPQSVFGRFLKNFKQKWNEEFEDRLEKSNYTMDEILTVASILEKEAKDADQMPLVASIIYNRLDSSSFPNIQCDSTAKYVENNKSKLVQAGRYASLLKVYDTYQVTGLPVGPISNPGYDAISAALSPEATDYYYFIHDATGQIYVARDQQEHQANQELAGIS